MGVGVIGAGNIGQAIATQLLRAGEEVLIANSRGPETPAASSPPIDRRGRLSSGEA